MPQPCRKQQLGLQSQHFGPLAVATIQERQPERRPVSSRERVILFCQSALATGWRQPLPSRAKSLQPATLLAGTVSAQPWFAAPSLSCTECHICPQVPV